MLYIKTALSKQCQSIMRQLPACCCRIPHKTKPAFEIQPDLGSRLGLNFGYNFDFDPNDHSRLKSHQLIGCAVCSAPSIVSTSLSNAPSHPT